MARNGHKTAFYQLLFFRELAESRNGNICILCQNDRKMAIYLVWFISDQSLDKDILTQIVVEILVCKIQSGWFFVAFPEYMNYISTYLGVVVVE